MNTSIISPPPNGRANARSSLACLPCRSRHLKCDGVRPHCNRCIESAKQCQYTQSRRGGLNRAALAERRKRLEATSRNRVESADTSSLSQPSWGRRHCESTLLQLSSDVEADLTNTYNLHGEISSSGSPAGPRVDIGSDVAGDPLVASYYKNFHRFHPFVLPQVHLLRVYQEPDIRLNLKPLIAILRFIGHIYNFQEWSTSLSNHVESCFAEASPTDPITVQCRILYSIALFWNDYKDEARSEMGIAARLGLDLQMFRQDFASKFGAQDAVLTESWRRTWWMLYMVDAYYAGTLGTMNFTTMDVRASVDLPCEEWEYEQGEIPEPQTLQDFDSRDLAPESTSFSSFAYLIGAVRCAALAISITSKVLASEDSPQILQAADSVINAWIRLLPKSQKQVMSKTGEVDELMFQAHLLIHVASIGLHRPLSDLKFNPVESISNCAREPPREVPTPELINVHTVRVLKSTQAQIRLLALPTEQFHHSPFTTCMVSEGILALLSACQFLFKEKELVIARDQIRMAIGCLKALGELWPRTARNVQQIQTIARHVLGLGAKAQQDSLLVSGDTTSLSSNYVEAISEEDADTCASDNDIFVSLGCMEDICGWFNSGDSEQDTLWSTGNPS